MIDLVLPFVLASGCLALLVSALLARQVLAAHEGTAAMQGIAKAIREGAEAFLLRQYKTIAVLAVLAAAMICAFYSFNSDLKNIAEMGHHTAWRVTVSFLCGALCSALAGYIGMFVSIRANIRTAAAAMTSLNRALQIALRGGAVSGLTVVAMSLLGVGGVRKPFLFAAGAIGIATAYAFVWITQYYTEHHYRPVRSIAEASRTGAATNIISGLAVGFECTRLPVLAISAALMGAYWCGKMGIGDAPGAGLYGTAIATMGMLAPCAYILAMDTFGPIADNAGGIVQMSGQPEAIRCKTDRLDAVGNTTKALTKGYAIGSAALAAFLLFSAYLSEIEKITGHRVPVDLTRVPVFIGALLGATLVFVFSALAIKAVGQAAQLLIEEVRRQFRDAPGVMAGTELPDYARCVDIVTAGALRQMVLPGVLAAAAPVLVGLGFKHLSPHGQIGAEAVAALLMVGTISGILMATVMNNGGGAWNNAKKYIESGEFMVGDIVVGRSSESHSAAVVGDTVGDPFKDTAGPSLHVLIKLLATITLVLAPLFIL